LWGPKRSFLEHIYKHCNDSGPGKRKYDDYGLPVPKMETAHDGIVYSFVSEDVWRCYAPGFMDDWEEYESRFDPGKKVKQVAPKAEFWDRPPGATGRARRLDTHWNARQMGVGREYVTSEKCWCMYPKSDTEICSALWVCLTLDPDHAESSPEQDAPMNTDDLGGIPVDYSVVGGHGVRAENTGWVNVMVFNLQRLQRKLDNSFVILWAGFGQAYYDHARVKNEWNMRFRVPFAMQLVSNEFLESQAAVAYTGSDGKLRMGFSTERKPVDRTTPPREDTNIASRERLLPDGRVTRMVTSLATVYELQPLGNPLIHETLPSETPDDKCMKVLLKDSGGEVREIKTKKPVEAIVDRQDPAVVRWFGRHGPGKTDYFPWDGQHEMRFRDEFSDFTRFCGDWDPTMTDDQYFGLEEWAIDVRFYNCRSNKAFSGVEGEKKGEPYLGLKIPKMPSLAWKAFDFMKSYHDPRMRGLDRQLKDWYKNVSWIATCLLRPKNKRSFFGGRPTDCRCAGAVSATRSVATSITDTTRVVRKSTHNRF
jgi:hypothetical protein